MFPEEIARIFREVLSARINDIETTRHYLQAAKDRGDIVDFRETKDGVFEIQMIASLDRMDVRLGLEFLPEEPKQAAKPTTKDRPESGWTVDALIQALLFYPKNARVHILAHTDYGAHNDWGIHFYDENCVYDEGMGDGPQKVPLILLD